MTTSRTSRTIRSRTSTWPRSPASSTLQAEECDDLGLRAVHQPVGAALQLCCSRATPTARASRVRTCSTCPTGPSDPKVEWLSASGGEQLLHLALAHPLAVEIRGRYRAAQQRGTANEQEDAEHPPWSSRFRSTRMSARWSTSTASTSPTSSNRNWGIVDGLRELVRHARRFAGTGYDPKANKYIYTFNPDNAGTPRSTRPSRGGKFRSAPASSSEDCRIRVIASKRPAPSPGRISLFLIHVRAVESL